MFIKQITLASTLLTALIGLGAVSSQSASAATSTAVRMVKVNSILFTGNTVEPTAKLLALVPVTAGQAIAFNQVAGLIGASEKKIVAAYQSDGYPVVVKVGLDTSKPNHALTYTIIEPHITSIVVTGNKSVPTSKIIDVLAAQHVAVGDVYNVNDLRKAMTSVEDTFNFATLGPVDLSQPDNEKVVVSIPLTEQ